MPAAQIGPSDLNKVDGHGERTMRASFSSKRGHIAVRMGVEACLDGRPRHALRPPPPFPPHPRAPTPCFICIDVFRSDPVCGHKPSGAVPRPGVCNLKVEVVAYPLLWWFVGLDDSVT